jgi:hypothetical protein
MVVEKNWGCGLVGNVLYSKYWFKVTVRVMGKSGGMLILRVGLARRTSAELSLLERSFGTRTQAN